MKILSPYLFKNVCPVCRPDSVFESGIDGRKSAAGLNYTIRPTSIGWKMNYANKLSVDFLTEEVIILWADVVDCSYDKRTG